MALLRRAAWAMSSTPTPSKPRSEKRLAAAEKTASLEFWGR
jgi:hypothetical protein